MKADGISTLNMQTAMQSSVRRTQLALLRAQNEYATGRFHDVGLALGSGVATNLGLRGQISAYENLAAIHGVAAAKADLAQSGLEQLKDIASTLVSTLSGARSAPNGQALASEAAQSAYASILQVLGTTYDGQPIFAGINTSSQVLTGYAGGAGESAVDAAFAAAFGFPSDSPLAIGITPSQLQNYLDTVFSAEFEDPAWNANWSGASSVNSLTSLEDGVRVDLSVSANSQAIRELVKAVVSVMSAAKGELNESAFEELAGHAMAGASGAIAAIGGEQSRIGIGQEALKKSAGRIAQKSDLLKARVQESEGVDQYEAAMRMNQLMTQLEASYAITARISKLSLADYL